MMRHCLLNGNAYALLSGGGTGSPNHFILMHRVVCTGTHRRTQIPIYHHRTLYRTVRTYLQEEVLHLRYASDDAFWGAPPSRFAVRHLGLALLTAPRSQHYERWHDGGRDYHAGEWLDGVKGKQALDALERYRGRKMPEKRQSLKGAWITSNGNE